MKQFLIDNGFAFIGTCNCGGVYTEKFRQGKTHISIVPRRKRAKIKGETNWMDYEDFEKIISEKAKDFSPS